MLKTIFNIIIIIFEKCTQEKYLLCRVDFVIVVKMVGIMYE